MTTRAVIVHGTGGHPDVIWYPWLADRLAARGWTVSRPHFPELNVTPVAEFLPSALERMAIDADTVLIGHSGGAALLLAVLEAIEVRVPQAVLVAGYATPPNASPEPVLRASYDWERIAAHVDDLVLINSVTDPYGCDWRQGMAIRDRVGGTLVVRDDGHFGDAGQPYDEFPLLDRLIAR
ncbi:alpha/beta fold hydrolase [Cellulomonas sp. NPDC089187]|uniref:alpha/beta fold hydrolase n=1 Tax=Cellulomonas sp. NPDC089187 TaxID=3154970 RepID=UPI00343D1FFB